MFLIARPEYQMRIFTMNRKYFIRAIFLLFFAVFAGQANATISCSFSTPLVAVSYSSTNVAPVAGLRINSGDLTCINSVTPTATAPTWIICVGNGAATAVGTGGRSGNYQMAVSSDGTKIPFTTQNARYMWNNVQAAWVAGSTFANFSFNAQGFNNTGFTTILGMSIGIDAGINVPANDYMTTIPIPLFMNDAAKSGSCTTPFSTGDNYVVNIPVLIRVAGYCEFHPDLNTLDFGRIVLDPTTGAVPAGYVATNLSITCPQSLPYTITVSNGNNSLGAAADRRRMVNTTNGAYFLRYKLLSAPGIGSAEYVGGSYSGTGALQRIGVYPRLTSEVVPMYAGTYSDTLLFFITF
jgi:spore coat protein U-like protein